MSKKVTVITPVFNNRDDILNAIYSVVNQTYQNWEYIIVDDCSKDGTHQMIQDELKKIKSNKVKLLRNAKNKGTYISINKAIKGSTGEYICLLGSDDTFHKEKLEKQVKILDEKPEIVWCDSWYQRGETIVKNNAASQLFRRSIIKEIGYFDSVRFGADSEFKHRVQKYYGLDTFYKINEVLYYAKIRFESLTRAKDTGRKDVRLQYKDNFKAWHKKAGKEKKLFMKFPLKSRPFEENSIMLSSYTPQINKYHNRKKLEKKLQNMNNSEN